MGALLASLVLHLGVGVGLWCAAAQIPGFTGRAAARMNVMLYTDQDLNLPTLGPTLRANPLDRPGIPMVPQAPANVSRRTTASSGSTVPMLGTLLARPSEAASGSPASLLADPTPVTMGAVVPDTPLLDAVPDVVVPPDLRYPPEAYADGRSGSVNLRVFVAPDGTVVGTQVLQAEPAGLFDRSATEAFYQARFAPRPGSGEPGAEGIAHVDVHVDYALPPAGEAALGRTAGE